MKKQLSMLAVLISASLSAQAAPEPFFTIEEVAQGYASGISTDGKDLIGLTNKNKQAEFFSTVHFADFLVDRFRFEEYCMLSGDVCETFWDEEPGFAYQWRRDFLDDTPQRSNVGAASGIETDGFVTALGETFSDRVGYRMVGNDRTAFVIVNDSDPLELKDGASAQGIRHSISVPTSIQLLEDGQYLVTGTAASGLNHVVGGEYYNDCFAGNDDDGGDYEYCPGVDTQASFWLLNSDGSFNKLMQANNYARGDNDVIQTASAAAVANLNGSLYGVGYSSTGEAGDDYLDGRNIASYWKLNLEEGLVESTNIIPLKEGEPVDDDSKLRHSWAVDINKNGYVVGNQRWNVSKGQNRPVELFVYNLNAPTSNASVPLQNLPFDGSGSEAAALNDHDMVVGWRDSRHQTQPVEEGTNRMQEALLLDAKTGANWYINDLICGLDDAGAKQCAQKDKYYHIAYARDISTNGTIAATAYRYDSESDLNNRINATVVAVTLNPIVKDYQGNDPASYVVSNAPAENQTSQDSGGGGGSLFWLTLLALPFAWLRRHQR